MITLIACVLVGGLVLVVVCLGLGFAGVMIRLRVDGPVPDATPAWEYSEAEGQR